MYEGVTVKAVQLPTLPTTQHQAGSLPTHNTRSPCPIPGVQPLQTPIAVHSTTTSSAAVGGHCCSTIAAWFIPAYAAAAGCCCRCFCSCCCQLVLGHLFKRRHGEEVVVGASQVRGGDECQATHMTPDAAQHHKESKSAQRVPLPACADSMRSTHPKASTAGLLQRRPLPSRCCDHPPPPSQPRRSHRQLTLWAAPVFCSCSVGRCRRLQ